MMYTGHLISLVNVHKEQAGASDCRIAITEGIIFPKPCEHESTWVAKVSDFCNINAGINLKNHWKNESGEKIDIALDAIPHYVLSDSNHFHWLKDCLDSNFGETRKRELCHSRLNSKPLFAGHLAFRTTKRLRKLLSFCSPSLVDNRAKKSIYTVISHVPKRINWDKELLANASRNRGESMRRSRITGNLWFLSFEFLGCCKHSSHHY